jgi:hypothetical protein
MAGEALFIGWGQVVRGREKVALGVFQEAVAYYGRLEQEGQIDGFDVYFLSPHGGDLAGFAILRGDRSTLAQIRFSDEFERLNTRAGSVIDSLGVLPAYSGDVLGEQLARFQAAAEEFGG